MKRAGNLIGPAMKRQFPFRETSEHFRMIVEMGMYEYICMYICMYLHDSCVFSREKTYLSREKTKNRDQPTRVLSLYPVKIKKIFSARHRRFVIAVS